MDDKTGLVELELDSGLYQNNLNLLRADERYWGLADRLETVEVSKDYKAILSKDNLPVIVALRDGREIPLCSRVDPQKEAQRWVDGLDLENRLDIYVIGLGAGYHIDALLEKPLDLITVIGLDIRLFKLLMHIRDISSWINERVNLLIDLGYVDFLNALGYRFFIEKVISRPLIVSFLPVTRLYLRRKELYENLCRDNILNARICLVTNISISTQQIRNSFKNFPYGLMSVGMEAWYDSMRDMPAICISAGPSVRDNIEFLRQAQDRAVLIAVDTVVPVLQKNGITPDFVIGLDFSEKNRYHYDKMNMDALKDSVLMAIADVHEGILPMWKGRMSVMLLSHFFGDLVGRKMALFKGLTTAHTAFLFAMFSGADPIILVGQDLSYPDLKNSHVEGTTNQTNLMLQKVDGRDVLAKRKGEEIKYVWARWIDGVDGNKVVTEDIMVSYLRDLERMIEVCPSRVIDRKDRGAKILGTDNLSIEETLSILPENARDRIDKIKSRTEWVFTGFKKSEFIEEWNLLTNQIKEMKEICRDAQVSISDIERRVEGEDISSEDMEEVNKWIDKLFDDKYSRIMQLAQSFSAAVMLMVRKFLYKEKEISAKERIETIMAFLEALDIAIGDVKELFEEVEKDYKRFGLL